MHVPLAPDADDYDDEMANIRHELEDAAARGRAAQQALDAIGWAETGQ